MKLLTIHRPTHPAAHDFCHGIPGELAIAFATGCSTPDCDCDRALIGLNSACGSTTVEVSDLDLGLEDAVEACIAYLEYAEWTKVIVGGAPGVRACAEKFIAFSAGVADQHDVGAVLRPRYDLDTELWTFTEAGKAR